MICGSFIESNSNKLNIQDVDGTEFVKAMDMRCGKLDDAEIALDEARELASIADWFQMAEVAAALDETVAIHLSMCTDLCCDVLSWSGQVGLRHSEQAARQLGTERFNELAQTEGFMRMSEEALGHLLGDDDLAARNEEAVWEALANWRMAGEG